MEASQYLESCDIKDCIRWVGTSGTVHYRFDTKETYPFSAGRRWAQPWKVYTRHTSQSSYYPSPEMFQRFFPHQKARHGTSKLCVWRSCLSSTPADFGKNELVSVALDLYSHKVRTVNARVGPDFGWEHLSLETFAIQLPSIWRELYTLFSMDHLIGESLKLRDSLLKFLRLYGRSNDSISMTLEL